MSDTHSTTTQPPVNRDAVFWAQQLAGKDFPPYIVDGLIGYLAAGVPPGSFLTSLLESDLISLYRHADNDSRRVFFEVLDWVIWNAPHNAWGNDTLVEEWMTARRAERERKAS